jgi:putative ABC transport system permease protein
VLAQTTRVGSRHLDALSTPLLRGRGITAEDRAGSELVAVVSESLATRLFPDGEALGQQILSPLQEEVNQSFTIVGITRDVATSQLQTDRPQIFVPLAQHPVPRVYLIARADSDFPSMTAAFEEAILDLDPDFGRPALLTGETLVRDNIGDLMQQSALSFAVAVVGLILSALGIYGVVAFMVASRGREMGIRVALGASARDVVTRVLRDTARLTLPGLRAGTLLAMLAVQQTDLIWYQLGAAEPVAYLLAASAALTVALVASLPSARRAASVDPMEVIRGD